MKCFFLLISFFYIVKASVQDGKTIVGEWNVISVDDGDVYWNNQKDSVSLSGKVKRTYNTTVGLQDRIAGLRLQYSHMRYVFNPDGTFRQYQGETENTLLFLGTYAIDERNGTITVKVKARTGIEFTKIMEYKFQKPLLYLDDDIHQNSNSRTKYVLEKVK